MTRDAVTHTQRFSAFRLHRVHVLYHDLRAQRAQMQTVFRRARVSTNCMLGSVSRRSEDREAQLVASLAARVAARITTRLGARLTHQLLQEGLVGAPLASDDRRRCGGATVAGRRRRERREARPDEQLVRARTEGCA